MFFSFFFIKHAEGLKVYLRSCSLVEDCSSSQLEITLGFNCDSDSLQKLLAQVHCFSSAAYYSYSKKKHKQIKLHSGMFSAAGFRAIFYLHSFVLITSVSNRRTQTPTCNCTKTEMDSHQKVLGNCAKFCKKMCGKATY